MSVLAHVSIVASEVGQEYEAALKRQPLPARIDPYVTFPVAPSVGETVTFWEETEDEVTLHVRGVHWYLKQGDPGGRAGDYVAELYVVLGPPVRTY